jgi:hypothetical protein
MLSEEDRYERDRGWADQFLPHQMELAREVIRVDVAPIEDDLRRNTDLILKSAVPLGRPLRISARVRHHAYIKRLEHAPGLAYRNQITIRDHLPSGVRTEMDKVRLGDGDMFIYGFESEPGSPRLYPWAVVNLDMIRDYDMRGGYSTVKRNKGERGTWLRVFSLDDLPVGAVLRSEGIDFESGPWLHCRNPNWDDKARPLRSGWCARGYAVKSTDFDHMRVCLFCGFRWHTPDAR